MPPNLCWSLQNAIVEMGRNPHKTDLILFKWQSGDLLQDPNKLAKALV